MEKSFWKELWLLLIFTAVGLVVCGLVSVLSLMFNTDTVLSLHYIQWSQTIFVMILPPILWYVFRLKGNALVGLGLSKINWRYIFLAILFVICSIPAFEFINYLSSSLPLPSNLKELFKTMAEENVIVINRLLSMGGIGGWIELIMLMSVGTAIGEELMFRGGVLKCFSFTKLNYHWQSIIVGLIFSLIHFEPSGFVERWILGTLLCYLVFWSGSIWPSIVLHATNNLVALIQYKCFDMTMPSDSTEMEFGWQLVVISFVVSALIVVIMQKHSKYYH